MDNSLEEQVFAKLSDRSDADRLRHMREDYLKKSPARRDKWLNDVSWFLERQPDLLDNFSIR